MFEKRVIRRLKKGNLFLVIVLVIVLVACGQKKAIPNSTDWLIEDFSAQNQDQETVTLADLKGKVWMANFIFTNCIDVCPPMTSNMSQLQVELKEQGIENVNFVSFSVDPKVDTPEVLKKFADQFSVDYTNWDFLTGYDQQYIENFARENFKMAVVKPENSDLVVHGVSFFLVNQEGEAVQSYPGNEKLPTEEIIKHIKILQNY